MEETLDDLDWMIAMQEELNNLTRNEVWSLVEKTKQNVIGRGDKEQGKVGGSRIHSN